MSIAFTRTYKYLKLYILYIQLTHLYFTVFKLNKIECVAQSQLGMDWLQNPCNYPNRLRLSLGTLSYRIFAPHSHHYTCTFTHRTENGRKRLHKSSGELLFPRINFTCILFTVCVACTTLEHRPSRASRAPNNVIIATLLPLKFPKITNITYILALVRVCHVCANTCFCCYMLLDYCVCCVGKGVLGRRVRKPPRNCEQGV